MQHFYSFVSQVCHWWCPPFSAGHAAFLFICLPGLSLVVSALFRWPCSISIHGLSLLVSALFRWPCSISTHLSPRLPSLVVSGPCHVAFLFICLPGLSPLAHVAFLFIVSQACHCWCPPSSAGDATLLFIPQTVCRYVGFVTSFLRCVRAFCHCWCPPISAGHAAFQFVCL